MKKVNNIETQLNEKISRLNKKDHIRKTFMDAIDSILD